MENMDLSLKNYFIIGKWKTWINTLKKLKKIFSQLLKHYKTSLVGSKLTLAKKFQSSHVPVM